MAVGCRIRRNFVRPDRALVEAFRGIPVANMTTAWAVWPLWTLSWSL